MEWSKNIISIKEYMGKAIGSLSQWARFQYNKEKIIPFLMHTLSSCEVNIV